MPIPNNTKNIITKMKMYKKPTTEVTPIKSESLMGTANNSIMHGGPGTGNEGGDIE